MSTAAIAEIFFCAFIAPKRPNRTSLTKTYRPLRATDWCPRLHMRTPIHVFISKMLKKGTSMGCRLFPEIIRIARNCACWAVPLSQKKTLESTHFSCFGDL